MEKGNRKKIQIQKALKELLVQKGYANVTMKDIGQVVELSVGGLYHHYHNVDDIFKDLIVSETEDVWELFQDVTDFDSLMRGLNSYFEIEKRELLSETLSINTQWYQYYFSFPEGKRRAIMRAAHDDTIKKITDILYPIYKENETSRFLAEHIFTTLQGLVVMSLSDSIHEDIIDNEFSLLRNILENTYRKGTWK